MRFRQIGLKLEGQAAMRDRLFVATESAERRGQIDVISRPFRLDLDRALNQLDRLSVFALLMKNDSEQVQAVGVIGNLGQDGAIQRRRGIAAAGPVVRQSFSKQGGHREYSGSG